jgi:hypothetical protein
MRVDDENFSREECAATAPGAHDNVVIHHRVSLLGGCFYFEAAAVALVNIEERIYVQKRWND